jgi:hypothetical protein
MGNCNKSSLKIDNVDIKNNINGKSFFINFFGNKSVEFQNNKDKKFNIYYNNTAIFNDILIDDSKTEPQLIFSEVNKTITNKIQGRNFYYFFIKDNMPIELSKYTELYNNNNNNNNNKKDIKNIKIYTLTYRKALLDKGKTSIELSFEEKTTVDPSNF